MLNLGQGDGRALRDDFHGAARNPDGPPSGANEDWTIAQEWDSIPPEDHDVWDILYERQQQVLAGDAVDSFRHGLRLLELGEKGIPRFDRLNEKLLAETDWTVVAVPGLVPDQVFFDHLANRRFPAGNFIRSRSQLDYLEEPDVFHDVFGHVPMLLDHRMAEWVQRLGSFGSDAIEGGTLTLLGRLYWRTVEFALAEEQGQLKILGAGIVSSFGESRYALASPLPRREPFSLGRVLSEPYRSDRFQELYFVVSDLDKLERRTRGCTWGDLLNMAATNE